MASPSSFSGWRWLSRRYPAWLGWVGVVVGAGSLVAGVMMFLRSGLVPARLLIVFALVVSLWMVAMGSVIWRRAGGASRELFEPARK